MTRITILCGGSRGDNQPYLALGAGLQAAGYQVRVVSDPEFEPVAVSHGLEFASTGVEPRAFIEEHMAGIIHATNPFTAMRQLQKVQPLMKAGEDQQARAHWEACQGAAAIIGHALISAFGLSLAQKLGVPFFEADVKPMAPTRAYPNAALPQSGWAVHSTCSATACLSRQRGKCSADQSTDGAKSCLVSPLRHREATTGKWNWTAFPACAASASTSSRGPPIGANTST